MQFVLAIILKLVIGVIIGLLLVPLGVVVSLAVVAIQAMFDEEPYAHTFKKRIEDVAIRVAQVGAFFGSSIG